MKEFSKYSIVRIKLTEYGYEVLENMRNRVKQANYSSIAKNAMLADIPTPDADGYVEMRLCDMMATFGAHMSPTYSPIEENIQISEEYLKDSDEDVKGATLNG